MSISEHFQQYDWCAQTDTSNFINEYDLDNNCVTEKILRNKFYDPLISSDSENETPNNIDWNEVFKNKKAEGKAQRIYVPGMKPGFKYPKLSALTRRQQFQLFKVVCAQNPRVLELEFVPRPNKTDYRVSEELKEVYKKEQEEFKEWAKSLWFSGHNIRALKLCPIVELNYDSEYRVRAKQMESFPKTYKLAAQIPLESSHKIEMVHKKEIISVATGDLPQIICTESIVTKLNIFNEGSVPEPCNKHPCRFVLPNESTMSILPLTEIHKQLATFSLDNGGECIASEGALKCLVKHDTAWLIPVSMCQCIDADGEKKNVLVLGSEFSYRKEPAQIRTYKAFRHLTQYSLLPTSEKAKILNGWKTKDNSKVICLNDTKQETKDTKKMTEVMDDDTDDDSDDENLYIHSDNDNADTSFDTEMDAATNLGAEEKGEGIFDNDSQDEKEVASEENDSHNSFAMNSTLGIYKCTCKGTMFERPPPRSYNKWMLTDKTTNNNINLIVHCAQKVRGSAGGVVVEPCAQYQAELGAAGAGRGAARVTSLLLRPHASLLHVRIDSTTGDVLTLDNMCMEELIHKHGDIRPAVYNTIHSTIDQLMSLVPGHYVLKHDQNHGPNALLYTAGVSTSSVKEDSLVLAPHAPTEEIDEVKHLIPPVLEPVLLPLHKFRKQLPCSFPTQECHVYKENTKPITRQKTPPQAIRWPKKRGKSKKRKLF